MLKFIRCKERCQNCYKKDGKKQKSDALKESNKRSKFPTHQFQGFPGVVQALDQPDEASRPQSLKCFGCSETITEESPMDNTCS